MLTIGVAEPAVAEESTEAATPAGTGRPTTTCSPSVRTRAKLRLPSPTPRRAPPAASIASTTREPDGNVAMPGRRTLPATSTTIVADGDDEPTAVGTAPGGLGPPD